MPTGKGLANLRKLAASHRAVARAYRSLYLKRQGQGGWLTKADSKKFGNLGNAFSASRSKLFRHGRAVRAVRGNRRRDARGRFA